MLFPPPLQSGDKVVIVSPAGCIEPSYVENTKRILEQWELQVVLASHALGKYGRFAGTKEERLQDLQHAFDTPEMRAIFCSRGGYGVIHLLPDLHFDAFEHHPKWVIGYSDVTALHAAVQLHNHVSLHAPMCRHLSEEGEDQSVQYLKEILFGDFPAYTTPPHPLNRTGRCEGVLRGGNLAVLSGLRGTPYDFPASNTLLFVEDIGEAPYLVERMFCNLKLGGILNRLSGLIVGRFTEYEEDEGMQSTLEQLIHHLVSEYSYPVCFGFPVGHVKDNYPMICGAKVQMEVGDDAVEVKHKCPIGCIFPPFQPKLRIG